MAPSDSPAEPATRWFLVLPLPQGLEATRLLAQHADAWVLDTTTGQMFSPMGWPAATAGAVAA